MQFTSPQTNSKNRFQGLITVVEQFLKVIRKRKVISQFDSCPPHMVHGYVVAENLLTFCSSCESPFAAVKAENTWWSPGYLILGLQHNGQIKSIFGDAPPPVLRSRALSLILPYWVVLVERRNFDEECHIPCFLVPIVFVNVEDESSVCDDIGAPGCFDEFRSPSGCNPTFSHLCKLLCGVSNRR